MFYLELLPVCVSCILSSFIESEDRVGIKSRDHLDSSICNIISDTASHEVFPNLAAK